MQFIKLNIRAQNSSHDTIMHLKADEITNICEASISDKQLREEINSIVSTRDGRSVACTENVEVILDLIKNATL